ncbi:hypothetical protein PVAG01_02610 [Phlyctema vagabunda]|uniref:Uncharacterized protein n=1 Tax=Phlyctema vagabunda TaxID=108571 RepID=A0ABR4PR41_9HELO
MFLPSRKLEILQEIGVSSSWLIWWKRTPRSVPFYTCGDQQKSCEAYNQPNVCCPVNMFCHPTELTPSEVFCCNATEESRCDASSDNPPQCLPDSVQCPENVGGGCCGQETICTPNGCLENASAGADVLRSTIAGTWSVDSGTTQTTLGPPSSDISGPIPASGVTVTPVVVKTITVVESAVITSPKDGEVAQKGAAAKASLIMTLCAAYAPALALLMMTAVMGLL